MGAQNQRISRSLQQNGEPEGSPKLNVQAGLELEAQTELQVAHRTSEFQAGDLARLAAGAVNATAVVWILVLAEARNHVVEQVKRFHAELTANALCNWEVFDHR